MAKEIFGYIYLIIDHLENKLYVGQKIGGPEKTKYYFGSGLIIKNIIKKRGKVHLEKRIIGVCYSQKELTNAEQECIYFFRTFGSDGKHYDEIYGYNLTSKGGCYGKGRIFTQVTKSKMSKNHANVSGENNPRFIKISKESENKILSLYKQNFNCKEIGQKLKINQRKISSVLKKYGVKVNSQGKQSGQRINSRKYFEKE